MIKVKTIVTTKKVYSFEGKSFWIEYIEENKSTIKNLCQYALSDLIKCIAPGNIMVSEDGIDLSFKVEDESTKERYIKIFEQINKDFV